MCYYFKEINSLGFYFNPSMLREGWAVIPKTSVIWSLYFQSWWFAPCKHGANWEYSSQCVHLKNNTNDKSLHMEDVQCSTIGPSTVIQEVVSALHFTLFRFLHILGTMELWIYIFKNDSWKRACDSFGGDVWFVWAEIASRVYMRGVSETTCFLFPVLYLTLFVLVHVDVVLEFF